MRDGIVRDGIVLRHVVDAVTGATHDPGDGARAAVPGAGDRVPGGPAVAS